MTPATVIATVAVVFAMTGGAYAAGKIIITSTKQISPKVLKQLKGANGKSGLAGPAGPAGAAGAGTAGAQGSAGPAGAKGENGAAGAPGTNGTSGKDGTNGKEGKEGSPWPAGGTLPKGATETGTWLAPVTTTVEGSEGIATMSFPIRLAAPLDAAHVHYVTLKNVEDNALPAGCAGTAEAPEPEEGNLCVFEGKLSAPVGGVLFASIQTPGTFGSGAGPTGSVVQLIVKLPEEQTTGRIIGTWAVTAG